MREINNIKKIEADIDSQLRGYKPFLYPENVIVRFDHAWDIIEANLFSVEIMNINITVIDRQVEFVEMIFDKINIILSEYFLDIEEITEDLYNCDDNKINTDLKSMIFLSKIKINKNKINRLIKLSYTYSKFIDISQFQNSLLKLMIKFKMKEEFFEYLILNNIELDKTDIFSYYEIDIINELIYDLNSASYISNYIEKFKIRSIYFKNILNETYNNILEFSKRNYNIGYSFEFCKEDIKNKSIEEMVDLFKNIEMEFFKKVGCYIYGYEVIENHLIFNSKTEALNQEFENSVNEFLEISFPKLKSKEVNEYDSEAFDEINNLYNELNIKIGDFITDFFEMSKIIKNFKSLLKNDDKFDELSKKYLEIKNDFELIDIYNNVDKVISSSNKIDYNEKEMEKMLVDDFIKLNIVDSQKKVKELLKYSGISKTLLSATWIWNLYSENTNDEMEKNGIEYTAIVANYLKAVEIFLQIKILEISNEYYKNKILLKPIFLANGVRIELHNCNSLEKITLGEISKYIRREKRVVKDHLNNEYLSDLVITWTNEIRNSHFHTDLILSKSKADNIKNSTIKLLDNLLYYLR